MSGIDDLKQNADSVTEIDMTGTTEPERIDIGSVSNNTKSTPISVDSSQRVTVSASEIGGPDPNENLGVDVRKSLADDILVGENSPFAKYVEQKTAEYHERMAEYDEEVAMKEEEGDEDDAQPDTFAGLEDNLSSLDSDETDSNISYEVVEENIEMVEEVENVVVDNVVELPVKSENTVEEVEEVSVEEKVITAPNIDIETSSSVTEIKDLIEEEDDSNLEVDQEDTLKKLQRLATERLKPVSKSLDISSFTILKKPSANVSSLKDKQVKAAKWVLPGQQSIVKMKEYLGSELEALREFSEDRESFSSLSKRFRSIYDHIVSAKPASYETWLKTTPYSDIDHYFFAVYIASFKGANFLPMDCADSKCRETFLTNDINIMDMVKFETEEAKALFSELYKSETESTGKGIYCTEVIPLSRDIAVSIKEPSIYNLLEMASLDNRFKQQYNTILEVYPYIDTIYRIDMEAKELIPIGYKTYEDNTTKTIKSRITKFNSVLSTLTVDEFGPIKAYVRAIIERNSGISYQFPESTCPKCGKTINASPATAETLVFTRYQLGALVSTSLK